MSPAQHTRERARGRTFSRVSSTLTFSRNSSSAARDGNVNRFSISLIDMVLVFSPEGVRDSDSNCRTRQSWCVRSGSRNSIVSSSVNHGQGHFGARGRAGNRLRVARREGEVSSEERSEAAQLRVPSRDRSGPVSCLVLPEVTTEAAGGWRRGVACVGGREVAHLFRSNHRCSLGVKTY